MVLAVLVAVVILVGVTIYGLWMRNFDYWKKRGIPGPKPHPIYGNTKSVVDKRCVYALEIMDIYRYLE